MAQAAQPGVLAPFEGHRPLQPGTRVQVGEHVVTVQRFLSQGGFARVYLVHADRAVTLPSGERTNTLVLKHMCVWNKDALRSVRGEVEHHRNLRGHTSIVHFVEASAANLQGDGWEIFILMEWAAGGGLIDFLNTRLQNRLQEHEVLAIMRDVSLGVQVMHAKQLVHRDLKIENILLSGSTPTRFKLCDFGSCFSSRDVQPARTPEQKKQLEKELNMHTTIWYRAPEMVDLRLEQVIDQRADIWALGVFLYKLCYYTTPFEGPQGGPAAIMHAHYILPPTPPYSAELKQLIASMLTVDPAKRPTIAGVLERIDALLPAPKGTPRSTPQNTLPPRPPSAAAAQVSGNRASSAPRAPSTQPPSASPVRVASPETESIEEALERFPSLDELQQQSHVRKLAARFHTKEATPMSSSVPRAKPRRGPFTMPEPAAMPSAAAPLERKPVQAQVDHTAVDIQSSDEDEAPEDVEAQYPFRVRKRDSVTINMEPRAPQSSSAPPPRAPVRSLSELLSQEETQTPGDTSMRAESPAQDELASLAAHEKALEALLQPSEEDATPTEPVVGDLLGIEGLSVHDRVNAWGRDIPSRPTEEAPVPRTETVVHPSSAPDAPRALSPEPLRASPSPSESARSTQADNATVRPSAGLEKGTSSSPPPGPTRAAAANLPPPSRARPVSSKPVKVAPPRDSGATSPRPTSPPAPLAPHRSATWDVASKPRVAPKPEPKPKPKQYVDASTSPELKGQELPTISPRHDTDVLSNAPSVRARMAQLHAQRSQTPNEPAHPSQTSPAASAEGEKPETASALTSSPRPETTEHTARSASPSPPPAVRSPPPAARSPPPSVRPAKPGAPKPGMGGEADIGATLLSQRAGQVRLTKRGTQGGPTVKPWEKEAAAARELQGRMLVPHAEAPSPSDTPSDGAEEGFVGVNALIQRWQTRNVK
ncbi:non-specific serine/threonine protein kinase [Malassezia brasiliensis]|uniref:non-specific serine/threonine protein kinase n=1 Tax=Malassezia brasiliensis TaxID=1821822 RepID=A0AAF0DQX3_9BASI|nr:non-specific serine/threonine protein kinase [Malassezia brasiliensis]